MIEVSQSNFQTEVIEASLKQPVLVDFWAPWCGPCRMLGPLLEKLEVDYDGKWKLVKVNTDQEQALAGQFRISGIPHCILFSGGAPIDTFTGALPEPNLRKFFDKHIPDEQKREFIEFAAQNPEKAVQQILDQNLSGEDIDFIVWNAIPDLIDNLPLLTKALSALPEANSPISDAVVALKEYLLRHEANNITQALKNIKQLFNTTAAAELLQKLLHQVEQNPSEAQTAKDDLVSFFKVLGQNNPIVAQTRRKLSMILN
ncbi:MAG: thioredoxin [Leptonema sp. (in: Bacteria)]|nr:thioredoxin [Leptonema sp. (in: bacteria)]